MKIVFLVSSLTSGGAERVATQLCNAWAARGDRVTLIPTYSGGGRPFYAVSEAVELVYLADVVGVRNKRIWTYAKRLHALRDLIAQRSPDVVISFLPNVNVAAVLATALLKIPLIICERNDPSAERQERSGLLHALPMKLTYRFADMLTVQTEAVEHKVHGIYPGLRKVRTVANPLPKDIVTKRPGSPSPRRTLISMGRLVPQKQFDRLIDAFAEIAPRFDDWDVHIYGEGPDRDALQSRIGRLGLAERVRLKGATDTPWACMAAADAFAMTSKYEGFPNVLLEAMGVGLPCLAFDCPSGPRDITRDGQDALLVPLNDHSALVAALAWLLEDPAMRAQLGNQARTSVHSRFGLSKVIDCWDTLFDEVILNRAAPTARPRAMKNEM
ncbi:glycosyltransferase family 4 protein [Oxalobacteraceae bacterium OM1]|nr:glycosyltransferase family 4 protein [Oxalobacteraceae bacterium OM1]